MNEPMTNEEFIMVLRRARVLVFWITTPSWLLIVARLLYLSHASVFDWCLFTGYVVAGVVAILVGSVLDMSITNLRKDIERMK